MDSAVLQDLVVVPSFAPVASSKTLLPLVIVEKVFPKMYFFYAK